MGLMFVWGVRMSIVSYFRYNVQEEADDIWCVIRTLVYLVLDNVKKFRGVAC